MNPNNIPIITIVTPSFNQGAFISETLNSVIEQEGSFFIDFIVIDGLSTDNTIEILGNFEKKIKEYPSVVQISGKTFHSVGGNQGVSFTWKSENDFGQTDAINKGIKLMLDESRYFNWLCSDDRFRTKDVLATLLSNSREKSVVYGKSMYINEAGIDLKEYATSHVTSNSIFENFGIAQPSALICSKSKEDLFLDLQYSSIMDLFLWVKLFSLGFEFKYLDNYILSDYRIHSLSKTSSWRLRTYIEILSLMKSKQKRISLKLMRAMYHECIRYGNGKLGRILIRFNSRYVDGFLIRILMIAINYFNVDPSYLLSSPKQHWNP
ncbi:Glycosyltransferase [Leptospira biflexa serovar Patoc strain 'Patoc 1 (Ames)']|uniref:Putative glycosyltransferase n=1 Tax=Leptospira biflexa serovar Patoc (strain Patoc 1 / ATCC 23582 / Paris) TaxID=456481 RepID=B0SSM1_LEPBP|nr:glycosyltransferase [Leptospira biflexa]ABZ94456.1 Glycosyltransferase [Leptospira biflexa serovar Patoc strain 'Patoc 1 (Ames)']ABZ98111.1 Putative glycosyltransferase [Leptospira biflexa serovar Patoc strain 'Patoc 1 (Paris)']